jgi:hypothetical protein
MRWADVAGCMEGMRNVYKREGRDHLENKDMDVWMGVYWTGTCGSVL